MQSVQNSAVNLLRKKSGIKDISKREFIEKCHWLCIRERIVFKMCLIMHKAKHHKNSPEWLQNLITYNKSERTLNLNQLPFKSSYGKRSFSRTGPRMWNLLPTKLKNLCETVKFKKGLKTFLFEGCDRFLEKTIRMLKIY